MNIYKVTFTFVSIVSMLVAVTVCAQDRVQNLAVVVNALENPDIGISTSLSIINLDEPDVEKAVKNEIIPLASAPSDIQIHGDLGYVVNTFGQNIQIIDLRNSVSLGEIAIGAQTNPRAIAFVGPSKAYVTCNGTNDIRVVDVRQRRVVKIIPGELKPRGITVINRKAYVTNPAFVLVGNQVTYEDSSVTVIDTRTDTILNTIPVPTNATGITNDGASKVLVISAGDFNLILGELVIIDTNTDTVERTVRLRTTPDFSIAINSMQQVFMNDGFPTNRGLMVYDLTTRKWIHDRNDALGDFANGAGLAIDKDDNVYVPIPDWTGGKQDELRVMAPDETLTRTYHVGPGASIVAIARIHPIELVQADVNSDGIVDVIDLVLVGNNFGKSGFGIAGDINDDGTVNIFDLVLVGTQFGERLAAPPLVPSVSLSRRVDALPSGATTDNKSLQRAIAALESYPFPSLAIRQITDVLRAYMTNLPPVVTETELLANYPNPFNPETWIPFQLSTGSQIVIRIYDQAGQRVRTLDLGSRKPGQYLTQSRAAFWDGKNAIGERVTSGIYFYQLLTSHYTATRKMVILK